MQEIDPRNPLTRKRNQEIIFKIFLSSVFYFNKMDVVKERLEIIKKNTVDLITEEELYKKLYLSLKEKKPLRVKIGFDPTAKDIHLGHTVLLRKLRKIQDLGHIVYFIIGDFTAQIGDPSGRQTLRPVLSREEILENARTYTQQAFKILDEKRTKVIFNSEWYKDMKVSDFFSLLRRYTVARMLERDDFAKRLKENKPLSILEFIYPLIQAYDSVKMKADVEFGGTDQKFNLIVGRHLQESFGQSPQVVITLPLLIGLDGKNKMSKSLGNYIGIAESAKEIFGKLMSISDELMLEYFRLLTDFDLAEIKKMHPKEAKLLLAETIVKEFYNSQRAKKEREEFEKVFSKKNLPSQIPVYYVKDEKIDIIDTLSKAKIVPTKNQVRRLLKQKAITSQGKVLEEREIKIPPEGIILKIGKRKFLELRRR